MPAWKSQWVSSADTVEGKLPSCCLELQGHRDKESAQDRSKLTGEWNHEGTSNQPVRVLDPAMPEAVTRIFDISVT